MFVHYNNKVVNSELISWIDYKNLRDCGYVRVYSTDGTVETVEGGQAIQLIMELDASALEGARLKCARYTWAVHNLIGHPLMQICSWLGYTRLGLKIHNITIPNFTVI